jgi:hypothetical protein
VSERGGVSYNDRTLVLGFTRSGKSELINHQFSSMRCQRLLIDTKDEWVVDGVERVASIEAIDWSAPIIHNAPIDNDRDDFDRLFGLAYQRRHLVVCVHELADLCEFNSHATPPKVRTYLSKGGAHGLGLLGASQRPVEMPKRALTECQHVFVLVPRMTQPDLEAIGQMIDRPASEVAQLIDQLHAEQGDHSFLWFNRWTRQLVFCKPLGEEMRRRTIVRKRTVA